MFVLFFVACYAVPGSLCYAGLSWLLCRRDSKPIGGVPSSGLVGGVVSPPSSASRQPTHSRLGVTVPNAADDYAAVTLAGVARQARTAAADRDSAIVTLLVAGWRVSTVAYWADMTAAEVRAVVERAEGDRCGHCGFPRLADTRFGAVAAWLHRPDAAELVGWHDAGRCLEAGR